MALRRTRTGDALTPRVDQFGITLLLLRQVGEHEAGEQSDETGADELGLRHARKLFEAAIGGVDHIAVADGESFEGKAREFAQAPPVAAKLRPGVQGHAQPDKGQEQQSERDGCDDRRDRGRSDDGRRQRDQGVIDQSDGRHAREVQDHDRSQEQGDSRPAQGAVALSGEHQGQPGHRKADEDGGRHQAHVP